MSFTNFASVCLTATVIKKLREAGHHRNGKRAQTRARGTGIAAIRVAKLLPPARSVNHTDSLFDRQLISRGGEHCTMIHHCRRRWKRGASRTSRGQNPRMKKRPSQGRGVLGDGRVATAWRPMFHFRVGGPRPDPYHKKF